MLSSSLFIFFGGIAFYVHVYYLPFYFQAVRSTTAEESGVRTIPYLLSNTLFSLIAGAVITAQGLFAPWVWFGAALLTIGSGLIHTLDRFSGPNLWIGYQVLAGIGMGMSIQVPFTAVQVVLSEKDAPSGISLVIFAQQLGGALAVSIAQNIFQNKLVQSIRDLVPGLNPWKLLNAGASHIKENIPNSYIDPALYAYQMALARTFILPIVAGGLAFLCSLALGLRSVEQPKAAKDSEEPLQTEVGRSNVH